MIVLPVALPNDAVHTQVLAAAYQKPENTASTTVPDVPFYSQFGDITSARWKKVGCGITSLAMIVDYYTSGTISVDDMLSEGIAAHAYLSNAGWTYTGLIDVANAHGLTGKAFDYGTSATASAYASLSQQLTGGPVIASVHYKFDPNSTIPHLVVIDAVKDGVVYYNDPAAKKGQQTISVDTFLKAWKRRFIVIRPSRIMSGQNAV